METIFLILSPYTNVHVHVHVIKINTLISVFTIYIIYVIMYLYVDLHVYNLDSLIWDFQISREGGKRFSHFKGGVGFFCKLLQHLDFIIHYACHQQPIVLILFLYSQNTSDSHYMTWYMKMIIMK